MLGYKYYLLSPRLVEDKHIFQFNQLYKTWKNIFSEVVEGTGGQLDPDDFFRNDYISAITHKNEVIGLSTMTIFDLRLQSTLDHHYIKSLNSGVIESLLSEGHSRILSIEYLTILPEWRKHQSTVNWGEILIGLNLKVLDNSIADIVLGTPRTDVKVLQMSQNMDAFEIQEPIIKMGYPCAVVMVKKQTHRKFSSISTSEYVESLWRLRAEGGRSSIANNFENPLFEKAS